MTSMGWSEKYYANLINLEDLEYFAQNVFNSDFIILMNNTSVTMDPCADFSYVFHNETIATLFLFFRHY